MQNLYFKLKKLNLYLGLILLIFIAIVLGWDKFVNYHSNIKAREEGVVFVYETPADSEEECTSHEYFDPESSVCYFECETEEECARIESEVDAELDSWIADEGGVNVSHEDEEDDSKITAIYEVLPDEKIELISGIANTIDEELWLSVADVSPLFLTNNFIETYQVFDNAKSDTFAYVDDEDINGKWKVAINVALLASSTPKERNLTIVHELSHIISLNETEFISTSSEGCLTYVAFEGCTREDSYLNLFAKTFWTSQEISDLNDDVTPEYSKKKFVTEYSTTNPEEDLAESFAYFVLESNLEKVKERNDIKSRKIAFFTNFPELLNIRESMREGIVKDILRDRQASTK